MQKVVSNSSTLIHLAKIGKLELLKDAFSRRYTQMNADGFTFSKK